VCRRVVVGQCFFMTVRAVAQRVVWRAMMVGMSICIAMVRSRNEDQCGAGVGVGVWGP
jgi:hypothetical protein